MVQTRNNQRGSNNVVANTATFTTPPSRRRHLNNRTPGSAVSVASAASDSSVSTTTSQRSRNPLPNHLLKQLCEDIEAYGGIQSHIGHSNSCYHLLNHLVSQDPVALSLYKDSRDPIRRKISHKVYLWQEKYKAGTYEREVLQAFQVTPASQRGSILQVPPVNNNIAPDRRVLEDLRPNPNQENRIPSSVSFVSNNLSEVREEEEGEEQVERFNMDVSSNSIKLYLEETWKNPPDILVLIGKRSKKNNEEMATRIDLYVDIDDLRDYQAGMYSLEWISDGSKLLRTKPSIPMYKWKKVSTLHQEEDATLAETKILEQHKVLSTKLSIEPNLNKCQTTLVLPDGIRVSNEAFNGTVTGSGTKFEGTLGRSAIKSKDNKGNDVYQTFYHVRYSMVVKGTTELTENVNKQKKEEEELAKMMQGTKINYESD
jgi:hypothetical protein